MINLIKTLNANGFVTIYVKIDRRRSDFNDFVNEVSQYGVSVHEYEKDIVTTDLIPVINYNKIIPNYILENNIVINIHIGLLPKWRGNSANGWGIINGEKSVGYTIHRVTPMLDAGPIYYQFKYPYQEGSTYLMARENMYNDLWSIIPSCLKRIIDNPNDYQTHENNDFVYCIRFKPSDGIVDWTDSTDIILRKFYVFGPPLGSGLKFTYNNKNLYIKELSKINGFSNSIGVCGSVVYLYNNSVWIKTGDSAISLDKIEDENGNEINIHDIFKIGHRLI